MPQFKMKKISSIGAGHPIAARLIMQTDEIIKFSKIPKESKTKILESCVYKLAPTLHICWSIALRINEEIADAAKSYNIPAAGERIVTVPSIENLDGDVRRFLYEAKNYLRDLASEILPAFYPNCRARDAAFWCKNVGAVESPSAKWAKRAFGPLDDFYRMMKDDSIWISELVRKRNAVEHPDGYSGSLTINDIDVHDSGLLIPPTWARTDQLPSEIGQNIAVLSENLLTFGEEIIAVSALKTTRFPMIALSEIPVPQRNPESPVRFRMTLKSEYQRSPPVSQRP